VYLQHIDIRAQPLHALLHRIEDVLPAQSDLIHHVTVVSYKAGEWSARIVFLHTEEAFRENHNFATGNGVLLEGFADDAL
jgi:hypothetical protein